MGTKDGELEGSEIQNHLWLYNNIEVNLEHVRPSLKSKVEREKEYGKKRNRWKDRKAMKG